MLDLEAKKQAWEIGFKSFAEDKEKQLKESLEKTQLEYQKSWDEKQNSFFARVQEILSKQIQRETFATPDQKQEALKPELEALFKEFFSAKPQKKWWKFW